MFRSPAGSEVSEGVRGAEITEQRESRFRSRSGQGLREGTRRTAPAGPFGTRGKGAGRSAPNVGAGCGRGGECLAWPSPWAGREKGFRSPAGARCAARGAEAGKGCSDRGCRAPGCMHAEVFGEAGVRRRRLGHKRLVGRRRAIPARVDRLGEPSGWGWGGCARLGHGHHTTPWGHRRRHRCLLHLLPGLGWGVRVRGCPEPSGSKCGPEGPSPSP